MKMLRITLEGKSYEVGVEVLDGAAIRPASVSGFIRSPTAAVQPAVAAPATPPSAVSGGGRLVASPMAGLVFKCLVKPGDIVAFNQVVIVLDAMKMETPISAPIAGTVRTVLVKEGDAVEEGSSLLQIDGGPQ
ncbi:MAG: biotin/lipoyl-binding protein [Desulfuromonadaceae bacterium]|nr:biotin/lipoyl-binding protein [Desulfuromonadaceae bacterium]MDD2848854.1 biotin/lipoyl-binding protein [Desulfuromonadaceae bacterium]MDD4132189.1 biotin/lipoyl-binding protein [Desulfuromonadaceae bacterium]